MTLPLTIEKIEDAAGFERLQPEWDALLETSRSRSLFLTWEWLFTWWKHLGQNRRLCLLTVRRGAKLVAIAPLAVRPPDLGRFFPFRAVEFLGASSAGSDHLDLIIRPGEEPEVVRALAAYLVGGKLMLDLSHFNREACALRAFAEQLERREWGIRESSAGVAPFVALAGHTWASYLATLGSEHRYNFQRRLRNVSRAFALSFEPARTEAERREALATLVDLHILRRRELGGTSAFHTPALLAFHAEVSRLVLARGWLRLFVLRLDGVPAAALYGFQHGGVFSFYQSGFDPAYAKHSVGLVAMGLAIKAALEAGAEEYDMLWGNERYKYHWARGARELGRLELYPPHALSSVYERTLQLNRAARELAKRVMTTVVPRGAEAR